MIEKMDAELFVITLRNLRPDGEYFNSKFSKKFINDITKEYTLVKRSNVIATNNPIWDILNNYNSEYIRFGDYHFLKDLELIDGVKVFCISSGTYLGFNDINDSIIEYDRDARSYVDICSVNSESFLKAVLVIFEYYSKKFRGEIDKEDINSLQHYIKKCGEAAGGSKYEDFYRRIL